MIRRPPQTTRTDPLFPYPTLFRSHFAGSDGGRADALVELANDPAVDALWIARGGWGAARIVDMVLPRLNRAAHGKSYMGYSDAGTLLAALYARGIGRRSEEHTSELQSLMRISYAVFGLKKKKR